MKVVSKEFNTWKLHPQIAAALRLCLCEKENASRYSIQYIGVGQDWLATTNGRCLLVVKTKHEVPPGLWKLTLDNYLLGPAGGEFPRWDPILLKTEDSKVIQTGVGLGNVGSVPFVVWAINHDGDAAVNLDMLVPMLGALADIDLMVSVRVSEANSGERPIQIESVCAGTEFIYVQMPVAKG